MTKPLMLVLHHHRQVPKEFLPSQETQRMSLFNTTQCIISICAFLVFITLFIFTLSTLQPSPTISFPQSIRNNGVHYSFALHGMGVLYMRGTNAMHDLVIAHVHENVTQNELALFLRLFHRSYLSSKADLVFIFHSSSRFTNVIKDENYSFIKLITGYVKRNVTVTGDETPSSFDVTRFMRSRKKANEPIWGKKTKSNGESLTESTWSSYGSIVGFEARELDVENTLSGFLDHVPLSLRRWACYTMLLGRVRRKFMHVMLVDVKNVLLLNDPIGKVRNRSLESVFVLVKKLDDMSNVYGRKNSITTRSRDSVTSEIIMGGTRGIRRFSNAMLSQVVRIALKHKNRVIESELLSELVGNEFILKDSLNLIKLIPEVSDSILMSSGDCSLWKSDYVIVQHSVSSNDLDYVIRKKICSCEVYSYVYRDCQNTI